MDTSTDMWIYLYMKVGNLFFTLQIYRYAQIFSYKVDTGIFSTIR
jgi:hypothetical protein